MADSTRTASPQAPKEPTQPVVKDAPQAPSAPAAAQAEVEQDATSAQGAEKGPIVDPADPVEGAAEEVVFVLVANDDAPDDLRVAFPGSHDVEGADADGYVTPPVQLNAAQAYAAASGAFTYIEERR